MIKKMLHQENPSRASIQVLVVQYNSYSFNNLTTEQERYDCHLPVREHRISIIHKFNIYSDVDISRIHHTCMMKTKD